MKKYFLVLATIALLSSCEQKNADMPKNEKNNQSQAAVPDSILMHLATADSLIYNYNQYLKNVLQDSLAYSSFMLDARSLRDYLNSNPNIVTLNVYLAKNEPGQMMEHSMNLVYIGAIDSFANGTKYNVEKPYFKDNDPTTPYFLNHSFPCPTCIDRVEAYQPPAATH